MNIKQCIKELEEAGFRGDDLRKALEYLGNPPSRTVLSLLLHERRQGGTPRQAIEHTRKREQDAYEQLRKDPALKKGFGIQISILLFVLLVLCSPILYILYSYKTEKLHLPSGYYVCEKGPCNLISYNPNTNEWIYRYDDEVCTTTDWKYDSAAVRPMLLRFATDNVFSSPDRNAKVTEPNLRIPLSYKQRMGEFTNAQNRKLEKRLQEIIAGKKAQVGIAVILDHKDTILINGNEYYPMLETAGIPLALTILEYIKRDSIDMMNRFTVTEEMRNPDFHFTLFDENRDGRSTTLFNLINDALQENDESAVDILTNMAGGVQGIDSCMRTLGFRQLEFKAAARDIRTKSKEDTPNRITPFEAVRLMEYLLASHENMDTGWLLGIIERYGKDDEGLAKPLEGKGMRMTHIKATQKGVGTEKNTIINDIGYTRSLHGYSIAVLIKNSAESPDVNERLLEDISEAVYQHNEERR